MGYLYSFKCQSCGYYAEVSGGDDVGMMASTTTINCGVCRELYDVVVLSRSRARTPARKEPQCPKVNTHPVTVWKHPGPCPRCGETLDLDPEGPVVLWD